MMRRPHRCRDLSQLGTSGPASSTACRRGTAGKRQRHIGPESAGDEGRVPTEVELARTGLLVRSRLGATPSERRKYGPPSESAARLGKGGRLIAFPDRESRAAQQAGSMAVGKSAGTLGFPGRSSSCLHRLRK